MDNTNNIYKKIQQARVKLQNKQLNKSGYNPFQKFNYFELQDFLPRVNEIFDEVGLYSHFNLYKDIAKLTITNVDNLDEKLQFTTPIQVLLNVKMQDIGSVNTYAKRYLYMNALEIAENDVIDAANQDNSNSKVVRSSKSVTKGKSNVVESVSKDDLIRNINERVEPSATMKWLKNNGYSTLNDVPVEVLISLWKSYIDRLQEKQSS